MSFTSTRLAHTFIEYFAINHMRFEKVIYTAVYTVHTLLYYYYTSCVQKSHDKSYRIMKKKKIGITTKYCVNNRRWFFLFNSFEKVIKIRCCVYTRPSWYNITCRVGENERKNRNLFTRGKRSIY